MSVNDNNFLLGIIKKGNRTQTQSYENRKNKKNENNNENNNVLIEQLMKIQENIRSENPNIHKIKVNSLQNKINNNGNNQNNTKKGTFKNILLGVITKLEDDVENISKKIENFNEEKKSIVEMDKREIERLKGLTRKLYKTILSIYKSLEVNKNKRIEILEKLKQNIEHNQNFLQNINELNQLTLEAKQQNNMNKINVEIVNNETSNQNQNMGMNQNNQNQITIFNLINKNKNENKTTQNENKNKTTVNTVMNTVMNIVTPTEEESKESTSKEPRVLANKRLNMSKKVSKKLDELPRITNQMARSELNQYVQRNQRPQPMRNQSQTNTSITNSVQNRSSNVFV